MVGDIAGINRWRACWTCDKQAQFTAQTVTHQWSYIYHGLQHARCTTTTKRREENLFVRSGTCTWCIVLLNLLTDTKHCTASLQQQVLDYLFKFIPPLFDIMLINTSPTNRQLRLGLFRVRHRVCIIDWVTLQHGTFSQWCRVRGVLKLLSNS